MTLKRAKLIVNLVEDLNSSFDTEYYSGAIVQIYRGADSYSVYLFSTTGTSGHLCELAAFACSIEKITCGLIVSLDSYDKGTTEPEEVQSIRIY